MLLAAESYMRDRFFPYDKFISQFIFVSKFARNKFWEFNPNIIGRSNQIYNFANELTNQSSKGKYFLYFGRLAREKGLMTLLDAFEMAPDALLKIAGEGPMKDRIASRKMRNVELLGFMAGEELRRVIRDALFVLVPSECYETLSMSVVESFSLSKPVIGTNIGALTELLQGGERGFVFQLKNSAELAGAVRAASEISNEAYLKMAENASAFAVENFSPHVHYSKLMSVYDKALSDN
jgi:glycosyltransferase involved in cell wall biosynthesis